MTIQLGKIIKALCKYYFHSPGMCRLSQRNIPCRKYLKYWGGGWTEKGKIAEFYLFCLFPHPLQCPTVLGMAGSVTQ